MFFQLVLFIILECKAFVFQIVILNAKIPFILKLPIVFCQKRQFGFKRDDMDDGGCPYESRTSTLERKENCGVTNFENVLENTNTEENGEEIT